jgi:PmbA protein
VSVQPQVAHRTRASRADAPLLDVCERLVAAAKRAGARDAEAFAQRTRESSVKVRDGNVEELHQATSKGVGLRVFVGGRLGFSYGTDFSREGLRKLAQNAVALAKGAAKDEFNELPRPKQLGRGPDGAYDPAIDDIDPAWKLAAARAAEAAAAKVDARVRKFDSTGAGDYLAHSAIASSRGAAGESRASYAYLYCAPVAEADGQLQTASWSDTRRRLAELQPPEEIGRIAAQRAARMLGARKVKTQRAAIIFEPQQAAGFVGGLAGAVNGDLVYKKSSFLAKLLGRRIASEQVTLVDDATLANGLATRPFDGEGIMSQRTLVIDRGVLKNFLYDTYTARKAGARSTGNAARSWSSLPHIGTSNFVLERGNKSPEEIVRSTKRGLLVTAMLGSGANVVTGEYSRGANGLWIEDGEIVHPVQEVTVSGSLLELLESLDAVGSDLELRSSTAAPTLRIAEAMISGS